MSFNYLPSATGMQFHECDKFVKMLLGPYGSGKSCCCAVDVLAYACAQAPAPDGVRYSRIGVIRATYNELVNMTRKSLMEVLPPDCGTITGAIGSSPRGVYIFPLADGTTVNMELQLFALKNADDVGKILSANWSFAWINEATGVSPEVFAAVMTRIGRYPSQDMGGVSWGGIIMDFNQPEQNSWLDQYVRNPEANWAVFKQPVAAFQKTDANGQIYYEVNPDAENLRNLGARQEGDPLDFSTQEEYDAYLLMKGKRYYEDQIKALLKNGRDDVVQNQYCMLDVPVIDGKPVYTSFSRERHVASSPIAPVMFHDIIIGMDQSGIHPAAVIIQNQRGKWCILDELYAQDEGLELFLHGMLIPLLREKYATNPITAAIDPSNQRDSWTATTPRRRLEELGIRAVTEITNNPKIRIQVVEQLLNLEIGGILVSPTCEILIRGFVHEYRYRRLRASGSIGAMYTPSPEKNDCSHLHDALQYGALLIHQGMRDRDDAGAAELAQRLSERRRVLSNVV